VHGECCSKLCCRPDVIDREECQWQPMNTCY
jgi:hypothetical protein